MGSQEPLTATSTAGPFSTAPPSSGTPREGTPRTDPIRRAVAAGEFRLALRLWNDFAGGISEEICRGTCSAARMVEASDLLEWVRRTVLCARSQAQAQLDAIHVARQYGPAPTRPASFLQARL